MTTAVLLATVAVEPGRPAAALALGGTTVLDRLHGQLEARGLAVRLLTRPALLAAASRVGEPVVAGD
ncbi:MAG: hypothetical protein M3P93_12715, partial [Actinomycetota bacterium]|nr:hypothetical protein [Actinomycetota bacterium]